MFASMLPLLIAVPLIASAAAEPVADGPSITRYGNWLLVSAPSDAAWGNSNPTFID